MGRKRFLRYDSYFKIDGRFIYLELSIGEVYFLPTNYLSETT